MLDGCGVDGFDILRRCGKADGGLRPGFLGNETLALIYNHVVWHSPDTNHPLCSVHSSTSSAMAGATDNGEEEWMRMNDTRWRGLGLTDSIKNIEVRLIGCSSVTVPLIPPGQMAAVACLSQSEGAC